MEKSEKLDVLVNYYKIHNEQVSSKIMLATLIYLFLSVLWNTIFLLFDLPYSRANLLLLLSCLGVGLLLVAAKRFVRSSPHISKHVVLLFIVFIVCSLYFGSGYREAWAFFFLVPLVSGFYGDKIMLFAYSFLGLLLMIYLGHQYPEFTGNSDPIDLSNRVLLYLIIATFSHLLLRQLNQLYDAQVNTIMDSAEATIQQVVNTFVIAIEAKDTYTFGHSERVSKYAVELARTLPEYHDKKNIQRLYMSGLLHDIGKINIPEQVLTKNGSLTCEEYELIKTHPIAGGRMVEKLPMLGALKPGVLYHHEKWDGSGYPTGIAGEEIPLDARILAIADVFDALTSDRSYREAMSVGQAFGVLEQASGTQFDPFLISKLPEIRNAWIKIYEESRNEVDEFEHLTEFL